MDGVGPPDRPRDATRSAHGLTEALGLTALAVVCGLLLRLARRVLFAQAVLGRSFIGSALSSLVGQPSDETLALPEACLAGVVLWAVVTGALVGLDWAAGGARRAAPDPLGDSRAYSRAVVTGAAVAFKVALWW